MIEDDEADAVSSAHQFLAKEDLLPFGSSDMAKRSLTTAPVTRPRGPQW